MSLDPNLPGVILASASLVIALTGVLNAILSFIQLRRTAELKQQSLETHQLVNSGQAKLLDAKDDLVNKAAEAAMAQGILKGIEQEKTRMALMLVAKKGIE